jgi:uncharacterized heparinase superfamily protein
LECGGLPPLWPGWRLLLGLGKAAASSRTPRNARTPERLNACLPERLAASIRQQANFLLRNLERDIGNNHLISNGSALVWCAAALPDAPEAPRWHRAGLTVLAEELARQVRPDGGHWENSPGYHL